MENFSKQENTNEATIDQIKQTTEVENSAEAEISPERIEALKGLENEIQEIAKLGENDLVEAIESPEQKEVLSEKLTLLAKVGDILKEQWPAIAASAIALAGIAVSLDASNDWAAQHGSQLADSAYMGVEKITSLVASTVSAFGLVATGLLYAARKEHSI